MTASGGVAAQLRDERLANGLRLITYVDRTTPVAADTYATDYDVYSATVRWSARRRVASEVTQAS